MKEALLLTLVLTRTFFVFRRYRAGIKGRGMAAPTRKAKTGKRKQEREEIQITTEKCFPLSAMPWGGETKHIPTHTMAREGRMKKTRENEGSGKGNESSGLSLEIFSFSSSLTSESIYNNTHGCAFEEHKEKKMQRIFKTGDTSVCSHFSFVRLLFTLLFYSRFLTTRHPDQCRDLDHCSPSSAAAAAGHDHRPSCQCCR